MNSKSKYFSSLLIALVAAFGYYILTDFNIQDIQLKTFSSLGIPFRMYQINNSVKQKKLPLPKVVYAYSIQQDELKTPQVELMADANNESDEFLAGLTGALLESEKNKRNPESKINDNFRYGVRNENPELMITRPDAPQIVVHSDKQVYRNDQGSFTLQQKVTSDDIEMFVTGVSDKNVKKIEECFKKIKVIYGSDNSLKNVIVNVTQSPNRQQRGSVVNSCTTVKETRTMRKASAVAAEDEEDAVDIEEDTDN